MSDDTPDDMDDAVRAQLEADAFVFGTGFAEKTDEGEYRRLGPDEVTLETDTDGDTTLRTPFEDVDAEDDRWQGSFTMTFKSTETVECPRCGCQNSIPDAPVLQLVSEGPLPCRLCGYSLL